MKKISFLSILVAFLLVFKKFFFPGPLVFAYAPYFYNQGLKELVSLPVAWLSRGNSLGGPNLFLWIYPLVLVYGFFGTFLHLGNDLVLRILFYFPSLIFGFTGVYFLSKYFKLSSLSIFFATLLYLINSYYLLLIDGGQVGVVLAYGLFPLVLYFLIKSVDKLSLVNFFIGLFASFILTIVDFRIAAICIFIAFILKFREFSKLKALVMISVCLIGLSFYWVFPTLKLATSAIATYVS